MELCALLSSGLLCFDVCLYVSAWTIYVRGVAVGKNNGRLRNGKKGVAVITVAVVCVSVRVFLGGGGWVW